MWLVLKTTLTNGRSHTLERRADRLGDLLSATHGLSAEQRARKFEAFADATGGGLIEVFRANGERALPSPSHRLAGLPLAARGIDRPRPVQ